VARSNFEQEDESARVERHRLSSPCDDKEEEAVLARVRRESRKERVPGLSTMKREGQGEGYLEMEEYERLRTERMVDGPLASMELPPLEYPPRAVEKV
jgi:hypothetical protein